MNVFYLRPLGLLPYRMYVQIGVLAVLAAGVLANRRNWQLPFFRITCLAVLMGYVILFSNSSEGHTYVIMLIGYQMWYWTMRRGGARYGCRSGYRQDRKGRRHSHGWCCDEAFLL